MSASSASPFTDPKVDLASSEDLPRPVMIECEAELADLVAQLERVTEFGVDTEADSFYSYKEKLCLIQISVGAVDYLVDPFAEFDMAPLAAVFANPGITKIFHDGEFDVTILDRECGFRFKNLFDTRVAAAALGMASPGLAAVLDHYFGIEVDKSEQRSDWSRRPLTESQIAYARLDTRYLQALKQSMLADLVAKDRLMVMEGECERLEGLRAVPRAFNPDDFAKIKGARRLTREQQSVLRELFVLRNRLAEGRDVPAFKILGNSVMMALAERQPKSPSELEGLKGFPRGRMRSLGREVMAAIAAGVAAGPIQQINSSAGKSAADKAKRLDDPEFELHERLREWRRVTAESENMESSLVLNRHAMLRLAIARPGGLADLDGIEGLVAWQRERYGESLTELVGKFEVELAGGKIDFDKRRRRR